MKIPIALLISLLLLAQVHAASPASAAVGSIVTVSGVITRVDANSGSFSVGPENVYFITGNSILTVNGKRANIADFFPGMKVSGSAEVAKSESRSVPQKKLVRMLAATIDPSQSRPVAAATPYQNHPHIPPAMPGPALPGPALPFTMEDNEAVKGKLSGTFWTVPTSFIPNGGSGTQWLSLNADGTTTSGGSDQAGTWRVIHGLLVQVIYYAGHQMVPSQVTFNAGLNQGFDGRFGSMMPNSVPSAWTLIASPTQDMLAKAPPRPASSPSSGTAPVAAETQQAAAKVLKTNHNNLVFVTGKDGAGSGFIASMDGANYLVTNAHVAAGISDADFKTLDGVVVQRSAAGVAVGHDICRMTLPPGGKPFEVMDAVPENAGIGDEVVVLGNAEGSGVINTIMGKIVGIGPNLVEIDAQFVPGNSGSPIVHLKTGKVIGVATYTVTRKYDATTKEKMKEPVVRRFGFRLDSVKTWQPVNWQNFYAQAAAMERIHGLTEALDAFFRDLFENKSHVTASRHTNPIIKTRISQWQESKSHKLSPTDRETADANFISFLKVACQTDLTEVQRSLTYDYFQRRLNEEQETRNEMAKAFTEIIRNIRE